MAYQYVYPNGGATVAAMPAYPNMYNNYQQGYSSESFSSDDEGSDDYEYRARMITHKTRQPRDIVRAPTPPPIIKRVVERAPTPEAPIFERVIIRPQAQEIVERVIEQPRTPSPRIVEKEMDEEAPPPIVRTRVIKVDRLVPTAFSQPGSPYGLPSFSSGYRAQSIVSCGAPPPMMMVPAVQPSQPVGVMQPPAQQMMYQPVPVPMQVPAHPAPQSYMPQNYMYPVPQPGMPFGYHPMMQQTRMIPSGMPMPMMATGTTPNPAVLHNFPNQSSAFFNPMAQQLVY